jgi:hypothetical protein
MVKPEDVVHKCPRCKMRTTGTWRGLDYLRMCPRCVKELEASEK